jgi:hypothetical protein
MKRILLACTIALVTLTLPAGIAMAAPPLGAVRQALVGTWQNLADTRFTREIDANGSVTDRYEGNHDDAITGEWIVFAGSAPPADDAAGRKFAADAVYLELRQNGDTLFFGLMDLTTQSLRMVYLESGNQLSFARIK